MGTCNSNASWMSCYGTNTQHNDQTDQHPEKDELSLAKVSIRNMSSRNGIRDKGFAMSQKHLLCQRRFEPIAQK